MKDALQVVTTVAHDFRPRDLVGGHPVLDFTNTVTARDAHDPIDWLDDYERLLDWAVLADLLGTAERQKLAAAARAAPDRAAAALERAKWLREALHDLLAARVDGAPTPRAALDRLDSDWKEAIGRTRLTAAAGAISPQLTETGSGLELVADRLAFAAVPLLADLPAGRLRRCAGPRCGWIFIDASKAGRRIWCDMATCGNAAKSRRHYGRHRAG